MAKIISMSIPCFFIPMPLHTNGHLVVCTADLFFLFPFLYLLYFFKGWITFYGLQLGRNYYWVRAIWKSNWLFLDVLFSEPFSLSNPYFGYSTAKRAIKNAFEIWKILPINKIFLVKKFFLNNYLSFFFKLFKEKLLIISPVFMTFGFSFFFLRKRIFVMVD